MTFTTLEQTRLPEQDRTDQAFDEIVAQIDALPPAELKEEVANTPMRKEAGSMDQGYRFN